MGRKNIQNYHGPVHNLGIQGIFQVAQLCRGKFIVTNHPGGAQLKDALPDLFYFSFAQIGSRMNPLPVLDYLVHRHRSCRIGQFLKLIQGLSCIIVGGADRNQNHALLQLF